MTQQRAKISIYEGFGGKLLNWFHTLGKPPYGNGTERDPQRCNLTAMPFEAPDKGFNYHNSKVQIMIWHGYDPIARQAEIVSIPPRGRIEIEAV